jgi:hypothetical protein
VTKRATFPPPEVPAGAACEACEGAGVTGQQYTMSPPEPPLVVDVFCGVCGGCGASDHERCNGVHPADADWDPWADDPAWDPRDIAPVEGEDTEEDRCPSCFGRQWWACQAFPDPPSEVLTLRMPCGCLPDDRLQEVIPDG